MFTFVHIASSLRRSRLFIYLTGCVTGGLFRGVVFTRPLLCPVVRSPEKLIAAGVTRIIFEFTDAPKSGVASVIWSGILGVGSEYISSNPTGTVYRPDTEPALTRVVRNSGASPEVRRQRRKLIVGSAGRYEVVFELNRGLVEEQCLVEIQIQAELCFRSVSGDGELGLRKGLSRILSCESLLASKL